MSFISILTKSAVVIFFQETKSFWPQEWAAYKGCSMYIDVDCFSIILNLPQGSWKQISKHSKDELLNCNAGLLEPAAGNCAKRHYKRSR